MWFRTLYWLYIFLLMILNIWMFFCKMGEHLPSLVRHRLEEIQRDFLWGGGNLEWKPYLVRWEIVCFDKKKGVWGSSVFPLSIRLFFANGIGGLRMSERLCGIKWLEGSMGKKVGCSQEVTEVYCVGLWKWIRKDWDLMSTRNSFSIGNGQRVRFWKDKWCGDFPLCVSFPSLFALFDSKEVWVVDI